MKMYKFRNCYICRAWRHVTWCRDWAKSGLGCRGSGGVLSAYSPGQLLDVSLAPPPFYPWKRIPMNMTRAFSWSHSGLRYCRRSQTATCDGKGCHRNTVHVDVPEFHFAPLQLHLLLWLHSLDVSIWHLGCCDCPAIVVGFMLWTWSLCCWCWCAFVRFGSVQLLAQGGSVLWTCLKAMHNTVSSV